MSARIHNSEETNVPIFTCSDIHNLHWEFCYNYCISAFKYDATLFPDAERTCVLLCGAIIYYAWKVLSIFCSAELSALYVHHGHEKLSLLGRKIAERKTFLTILSFAEEYLFSIYNFKTSLNRIRNKIDPHKYSARTTLFSVN